MKKIFIIVFGLMFLSALSVSQAGQPLGPQGNLDPSIARPNSNAFGKSLDEWMEAYLRWLEDGADPAARIKNVAFLPIIGESPFEVTVKPGTALVLPVATWIGEKGDDPLPDEWFGDRDHVFGDVYLDGELIVEPNEDYYVGPTDLTPPLWDFYYYYQAIVVVILPLSVGEHVIDLHSEFVDGPDPAEFDNIWYITVIPNGKN